MKPLVILSLLVIIYFEGACQNTFAKTDEFTFMFYNVENFFDCQNDPVTNDDEFLPDGDRRWNYRRLNDKADRLAKVILAAGRWNPPVFVGLCEVENLSVLELLTRGTALNKFGYKMVHKDSPDERGIDVALLYRPDLFRPFDYQAIPVVDPTDQAFRTRDILLVSGVINQCDTLHVFVNHWPSRYGGVMETIKYRRLAAETLKRSVQGLNKRYQNPKIISTGDFNDSPSDESLARVLIAKENCIPDSLDEMISLSFGWKADAIQTIKNQYSWEVFDQWIVSGSFLKKSNCCQFLNAEIFKADFLLEADSKFGGVKPKRTYNGFKYQEGFSDHLPVLLRVRLFNH